MNGAFCSPLGPISTSPGSFGVTGDPNVTSSMIHGLPDGVMEEPSARTRTSSTGPAYPDGRNVNCVVVADRSADRATRTPVRYSSKKTEPVAAARRENDAPANGCAANVNRAPSTAAKIAFTPSG